MIINSILLSLAVALMGCGGGDDDNSSGGGNAVTITVQPASLDFSAEGGTYNIAVTTTGKEWGAYADAGWVTVSTANTTKQQGTVTVTAEANPTTTIRTATITVMSGAARKQVAVTQAAATSAAYPAPDGYSLVWHDEFNNGSELNADDWTHEVQNSGWVNNELQNYVNHVTPGGSLVTEVKNGSLQIHCLKENGKIYSGRVYARVKQGWKYGYIEARIKLPKGKGTWPAFWMMPVNFTKWPDDGEIDIMEEVGYHPNYTSSSIHCEKYNHQKGTQKTEERFTSGAEDDFHVYALEWTRDYIKTYVDGNPLLNFDNDGTGDYKTWPFNKEFYVIFNLAWGGAWGGQQGVDESVLPATMQIDYIRVFQK